MDELRAPPAGAERPVVGLDQHDAQPAGRRVEGRAGAGDATADDQQVDGPAIGQRVELARRRAALSACDGHGLRYPSIARASSRRHDAGGQVLGDHLPRLDGRLRDQQHHRRQLGGLAAPHGAAGLQPGDGLAHDLEQCPLAGAELVDDVVAHQPGVGVERRRQHLVGADLLGQRDRLPYQRAPVGDVAPHAGEQPVDLAVPERAQHGVAVLEAPVHRRPADPGLPSQLGDRRAPSQLEAARGRVQNAVLSIVTS